jgi:hypothetical protein
MTRRLAVLGLLGALAALPARGAEPAAALAPGDRVQAFDAQGIDGQPQRIGFDKGPDTILLFFLSGCPACHKMLPLWNQAFERRPDSVKVVGVLLDREPPGFFMATPIAFPVVRGPGGEFNKAWKLNRVPMMLRVAPGGRVTDAAVGPVDALRVGEIFRP